MKPMLAHKYKEYGHLMPEQFAVQPKLNGIRMLASLSGAVMQSRDEHLWQEGMMPHIKAELKLLSTCLPQSYVLDGEVYVHGWSLQQINGAGGVNRKEPNDKTLQLEYHVFDVVNIANPESGFVMRWDVLERMRWHAGELQLKHIKFVETCIVSRPEDELHYTRFKSAGYEGMMYRDLASPYGLEHACTRKDNRWKCLLKRKEWEDEWFHVVDFVEGEGKHEGRLGALVCLTKEGRRFNVGTGFSDAERESFWYTTPLEIHVQYEMLSDDLTPLKPIYLEAR